MNIAAFQKEVKKALNGENTGIPFTIQALNRLTGGILKGYSYLIMGKSGTGKTSFMYEEFIFNIVDKIISGEMREEDVRIVLYSMEMSDIMFMFKAAARWMYFNRVYEDKRILTDTKQLSGAYGIPPAVLAEQLESDELIEYLELLKRVIVFLTVTTPTEMYNYVGTDCTKRSTLIGKDDSGRSKYAFNNPNQVYIVALDHISLVTKDEKSDSEKKKIIDDTSSYLRRLKNGFGITPVILQQITPPPQNGGIKKLTMGYQELRDSKDTYQDIDFCLSLGSPFHDQIKAVNYKDGIYHIMPGEDNGNNGLQDRLRLISVEKDRYGNSSMRVAASYLGEIGLFRDIAPPDEVKYEVYAAMKKTF